MARPRRIDPDLVQKAREAVKHTQDGFQLRQALAVLLPADTTVTLEQTAKLLGVGRATVVRYQRGFRDRQQIEKPARKSWGGRRRFLMSWEAEQEFLRPWAEQAKDGGLLVLSPIRAALAQQLGRPVARSVVWRLLARHDWRKIAPDTRHPKSDPQVQEDWKKNFRKCWRPC
jgi:transposase